MNRAKYDKISLHDWTVNVAMKQDPAFYATKTGIAQAEFIRDVHTHLFSCGLEPRDWIKAEVVSWHVSKSVKLPVYHLQHPALGIRVWMRGNFENWVISVLSERPVQDVFFQLFQHDKVIPKSCAEGFSSNWVFGSYAQDNKRFTIELSHLDHSVWVFLYLLISRLYEPGVTLNLSEEGARSFISDSSGWGAIGLQEIEEGIYTGLGIDPLERQPQTPSGLVPCSCGCGRLEPPTPKFQREDVVIVESKRALVMSGGSFHQDGYWQYALSEDGTQIKALPNNPYKEDELKLAPHP